MELNPFILNKKYNFKETKFLFPAVQMMQNSEQQLLHAAPPTTGLHSSVVYALLNNPNLHGSIPT